MRGTKGFTDARSLWQNTAEPGPAPQMLETDLSTEVVIVGGKHKHAAGRATSGFCCGRPAHNRSICGGPGIAFKASLSQQISQQPSLRRQPWDMKNSSTA
jgi:hypothetical protein